MGKGNKLLGLLLTLVIVLSISAFAPQVETKTQPSAIPSSQVDFEANDFRRLPIDFVSWQIEDDYFHLLPNESNLEFASRVTAFIYNNSFHCNTFKYYLGPHSKTSVYGLLTPEYAPCGLCSQINFWVNKILRENNIDSDLLGIEGHVVATLNVSGSYAWILDADYGIAPFLVNLTSGDSMKRGAEIAYAAMLNHSPDSRKVYNKIVSYYSNIEDDSRYNLELLDEIYEDQKQFLKQEYQSPYNSKNRIEKFELTKEAFVKKIANEVGETYSIKLTNAWYKT